jgi:dTMP kinase
MTSTVQPGIHPVSSRATPFFISFEGIDGCGKSTLMEFLISALGEAGISYVRTREPGGTSLGENIRSLLLNPANRSMDEAAEVLLYTASRAQLVREVIRPALHGGTWVIADRYTDATLAYQGYGRGLDLQSLRYIQDWATGSLQPHRTILLDCAVGTAFQRMELRSGDKDRIEEESRAFHERVRDGYLQLASAEPERFVVLDAERPVEGVVRQFKTLFWGPFLRALGTG